MLRSASQINFVAASSVGKWRRLIANLHAQRVEKDDGIHRVERPRLPAGHFRRHGIRHHANQIGRDVGGVHLGEKRLKLANREAPRLRESPF